jgi:hypothetical protein
VIARWSVERLACRVWIAPPAATVLIVLALALNWGRSLAVVDARVSLALLSVVLVAIVLSLVLVGALIAARRPRNPIGWLLLQAGLLFVLAGLAQGYAFHVLELGRPWPGGAVANWFGQWLAVPAYVGAGFLFLVFPDGRLPSPRWRGFARLYALLGAAYTVAFMVEEWPRRYRVVADLDHAVPYIGATVTAALWPAFVALLAVPVVSVFLRYRRAAARERVQIRWLAPAGVGIGLGPLLAPVEQIPFVVTVVLAGLGGVGLPVAIGIAILRYRLYAIDRIISRTVTYGLVVAVLAAVYATGVIGLGTAVSALTGVDGSELVIAASTLSAVALFGPVRARVQRSVDRRFNRSGYAAWQVVDAFESGLRDEVDLSTIRREMARTTASALQPAHVSLWLVADRDGFTSVSATPERRP